jgi:hypothetical protein
MVTIIHRMVLDESFRLSTLATSTNSAVVTKVKFLRGHKRIVITHSVTISLMNKKYLKNNYLQHFIFMVKGNCKFSH